MKFKMYIIFVAFGFLIISLGILQQVQAQYTADGEPVIYYVGPLEIVTPVKTTTYTSNSVCLNFTVYAHFDPNVADVNVAYSLDSKDNVTIPISFEYMPVWITDANGNPTNRHSSLYSYYLLSGCVELVDLSQGAHSLTVFARYDDYARNNVYFDKQTICFTIDTVNSPSTADNNIDAVASMSEFPTNTVYAVTGVISLVAVVSFALFTKRGLKDKNVISPEPNISDDLSH